MLILLIALFLTTEGKWVQKGQWQSFNYTNSSLLFSLLPTNHGDAEITEIKRDLDSFGRYTQILQITLKSEENMLIMDIWMRNKNFPNEVFYSLISNIQFALKKGKQSPVNYNFNIAFNITLTHRKKLSIDSTEGRFIIDLIDNQIIFPNFMSQLFAVYVSAILVGIPCCIYACKQNNLQIYSPVVGQFAMEILLLWNIRVLVQITFFQQYLVPESDLNIVTYGLGIIALLFYCPLAYLLIGNPHKYIMHIERQKLRRIFKAIIEAVYIYRLVFQFQDQLNLIYVLGITVIYQILVVLSLKPSQSKNQWQVWVFHFALYLFPIAIFPYYRQQVNYPKAEADVWWVYILFYAFDATAFYLKSNGGVILKLKYNLSNCRYRKGSSQYQKEDDVCPICLKPTQIYVDYVSSDSINAVRQNTDVILHSCNHYFHKACIQQIGSIQACFFDSQKWQKQSEKKKAIHQ